MTENLRHAVAIPFDTPMLTAVDPHTITERLQAAIKDYADGRTVSDVQVRAVLVCANGEPVPDGRPDLAVSTNVIAEFSLADQ